jgi:hypothetical protein
VNCASKFFGSALLWIALFASALVTQAADKMDFQCLEQFKSVIVTNETLALSGVDVATLADGKTYLLSLGTTANQAKQDSSIRAKLDTRKVAEAKARKAAAEFLKVEVQTEDKLTELRKTEKVSTNEGLKSQVTKLIRVREEIITQKSQVVFAGSKTVASWLGDDGESFNAVVASEIKNKQ